MTPVLLFSLSESDIHEEFAAMVALRCQSCGTALMAGVKFCRRCGEAVTAENFDDSLERPTQNLEDAASVAPTRRLTPKATSPTMTPIAGVKSRRKLLIGMLLILVAICLVVVTILWLRKPTTNNASFIYPGARTVLDMTAGDGSRTVHLQTSDPLDKVENWYQSNFKLTKTTKLTTNSYVLRNDAAIITLVVEDNVTNILVKQSP